MTPTRGIPTKTLNGSERNNVADNGTVTAAQPGSAPAQPAAQPVQPAAPSIDPGEFQRLQRIEQQYNGMKPFVEKARSYGFDKAEAFDRDGPAIKAIRERGFDPAAIAKAFAVQQDDNPNASPDDILKRLEARMDERLTAKDREWVIKQAEKEHEQEIISELGHISKENVAKVIGDDVPGSFSEVARLAALGMWFENRKPFESGHPLQEKGYPRGVGKEGLEAINKFLTDSVTGLRAHQWKKLGAAARNPSSTVAAPPNQGKPEPKETRTVSGVAVPSKEEIQAAYDQMKARRATA